MQEYFIRLLLSVILYASVALMAGVPAEAIEPAKPERDSAKAYMLGFADGNHDPQVFASNFTPIDHATCAGCHQSTAASDSCRNCHTYHVDPAGLHGIQAGSAAAPGGGSDIAVNRP